MHPESFRARTRMVEVESEQVKKITNFFFLSKFMVYLNFSWNFFLKLVIWIPFYLYCILDILDKWDALLTLNHK